MPTISIRVTDAQKAAVEDRSRGNVSDYIKRVLFEGDEQREEIERLSSLLEFVAGRLESATAQTGVDKATIGILAELLLLIRMSAKPDAKKAAQAEVERLGLPVFGSETYGR